ncbi:hypothetical protein CCMA1212_006328 [Trichoderma ghanense]|uniref:Zinc ribbon domain-containing protein n=1 Tax=Trichoderma ghanense TaxID=65468 RepID=A0ABY2H2Y3_9HYPO
MQPINFNHASCPKCSATITSGTKTCQSCGAVRLPSPLTILPLLFFNISFVFYNFCYITSTSHYLQLTVNKPQTCPN